MKHILFAALAILAFGAIGAMDLEDQLAEDRNYCAMVEAGAWGDYNPRISCPWREQ